MIRDVDASNSSIITVFTGLLLKTGKNFYFLHLETSYSEFSVSFLLKHDLSV